MCRAGGLRVHNCSLMEVAVERIPLKGLSLTRAVGERIVIVVGGREIWVEVVDNKRSSEVGLKIQADQTVHIFREELWNRMMRELDRLNGSVE